MHVLPFAPSSSPAPSDPPSSLHLIRIRYGPHTYELPLSPASTFDELTAAIGALLSLSPPHMKLIHKGKRVTKDSDLSPMLRGDDTNIPTFTLVASQAMDSGKWAQGEGGSCVIT